MQLTGNWSFPTAIRFGAGRISELADACNATGMKKPLLVTDRGLASLPITQNALALLEQAGLGGAMFSEVDPNPNEINLEAVTETEADNWFGCPFVGWNCGAFSVANGTHCDKPIHG